MQDTHFKKWVFTNKHSPNYSTDHAPIPKYASLLTERKKARNYRIQPPSDTLDLRVLRKYKLEEISPENFQQALRKAAFSNGFEDVKYFIKKVDSLNARDGNSKSQRTALHWAVRKRSYESAEILLEAGAKFDIPDANNQTAKDLAEGDEKLKALFEKQATAKTVTGSMQANSSYQPDIATFDMSSLRAGISSPAPTHGIFARDHFSSQVNAPDFGSVTSSIPPAWAAYTGRGEGTKPENVKSPAERRSDRMDEKRKKEEAAAKTTAPRAPTRFFVQFDKSRLV